MGWGQGGGLVLLTIKTIIALHSKKDASADTTDNIEGWRGRGIDEGRKYRKEVGQVEKTEHLHV